jgi:nucleoid-associated protein YgaU
MTIRPGTLGAPVRPRDQVAQGPAPPAIGDGSPVRPAGARETPAIAIRPSATPPGLARSTAVLTPQVESYDEEVYRCRPNDTFRSISAALYLSDRYERALLLYNRNHFLASDAVRQDPPVLQAGQTVYVPPTWLLEKQYPAVIPERAAPPPAVTPAGLEAPQPIRPAFPPPRPVEPAAGGAGTLPAGEPLYRVRNPDERLWAIARRTLGKAERWTDLYRLNPRLDPAQPVPVNTVLRLPSGAQVPAENRP